MKYKYKTLRGLLRNTVKCLSIYDIFYIGRSYKPNKGLICFKLSEDAKREAAVLFARETWKDKDRQKEVINALMNRGGQGFLFQCFYISYWQGHLYVSTTLSGEAYESCKRRFLR